MFHIIERLKMTSQPHKDRNKICVYIRFTLLNLTYRIIFDMLSYIIIRPILWLEKLTRCLTNWLCIKDHSWIKEDGEAPDTPLDNVVLHRLKQFRAMNKFKKVALRVIIIKFFYSNNSYFCGTDFYNAEYGLCFFI